jgi:peptidoglycan/xylan/chitin deacetylase (PgdA/CDA1 family)
MRAPDAEFKFQKAVFHMALPSERAKYSAIVDRPKLHLPNGERVVIWTIVNVEVWDIARPMPRQVLVPPTGVTTLPDVPNWSWHEYGMRIGFWRFHALYERLKIRPSLSVNARVCIDYPRVAQACKDAGWEFMGHSFDQRPMHGESDAVAMIERSVKTIREFTGKPPIGWMGPGLTETYDTPDQLKAAGIKYICDWVWDDEPAEIETKNGPLYTLPYSLDTNDIPVMAVQYHEASYWTQKCKDAFDRLYEEGASRPKIMAIAIHPYLSGQPSRIKYLEAIYEYTAKFNGVLYWTGEQILDWYLKARKK